MMYEKKHGFAFLPGPADLTSDKIEVRRIPPMSIQPVNIETAVETVRSGHMPSSVKADSRVTAFLEDLRYSPYPLVQNLDFIPGIQTINAVNGWSQRSEQRHMRRSGKRRLAESVLEKHGFSGKRIYLGGGISIVSVTTQMVGAQCIYRKDYN